jgi:hypothetical protein
MPAFFAPATALAFSAVLPGLGNFTSNVLSILPMICMIGMALPFLNLHHPHLYINLSCKVLLLYLPGRQQPVEQNRQADDVHHNHNAPVVKIGINIVRGGRFHVEDRNSFLEKAPYSRMTIVTTLYIVNSLTR